MPIVVGADYRAALFALALELGGFPGDGFDGNKFLQSARLYLLW